MSKKCKVELTMAMCESFPAISNAILAERTRQIEKWGDDDHEPDKFVRILGEEFGEICRAIEDDDWVNYREECVQVAAVCVRMIQSIDRVTP